MLRLWLLFQGVKGSNSIKASVPDHKTLVLTFDAASKPEIAEITGQFAMIFSHMIFVRLVSVWLLVFEVDKRDYFTTFKWQNILYSCGWIIFRHHRKNKRTANPVSLESRGDFWRGLSVQWHNQIRTEGSTPRNFKDFVKSMSEIFPNDPLPDLFVPGELANNSVTLQPFAHSGSVSKLANHRDWYLIPFDYWKQSLLESSFCVVKKSTVYQLMAHRSPMAYAHLVRLWLRIPKVNELAYSSEDSGNLLSPLIRERLVMCAWCKVFRD